MVGLGVLRLLLHAGYAVDGDLARLWLTPALADRYHLVPLALALLLTFLSYPRISDFKLTFLVVSSGSLAGAEVLFAHPGLAALARWILGSAGSDPVLVFALVGGVNLLVATLMPDVQSSAVSWELSGGVLVAELAALAAVSRLILPWLADHNLLLGHPFPLWGYVILLSVAAALLSRRFAARNYGLGGGIAGAAVLLSALPALRGSTLDPACAMLPGLYLLTTVAYVWIVRLRFRISYDPLMQIYNRAHCDEIMASAGGRALAVAMIDVDRFKELNDRHGHAAGDAVLHRVAQAVRRAGLPEGICCRYGGEEIIVFLDGAVPAPEKVFERMRRAVEHLRIEAGGREIRTTVSIGWAATPAGSDRPPAELVVRADRALYRAKEAGRNCVMHG